MYKRQKHRPAINSTVLRYPHKTSTLRSNRNISALKDGTLKSAEIINFWQSQSVDNQCLFFCQNVTSFTGKEKDSETGFYYFGARYYDPNLSGLFLSVDPMADKYPSISPYAYCAWNPVKLIDPDGRDIYRLDAESGSLMLYKKNKKNYDVIEVGTTNKIGRATLFNKKSEKRISKGILEGKENQDISQTGFVTCSNRQEEALEVAVFISFSCHKELSGVGYEGIMRNQDLEVFAWASNTSNHSDNPVHYSPSKGGESKFHFHTHCGNKNGKGGYANPGTEDKNAAATLKKTSGINTFVIISQRGGSVLYDENGKNQSTLIFYQSQYTQNINNYETNKSFLYSFNNYYSYRCYIFSKQVEY